jgi:DNA polymerase III epsilon subunit-like protein
MIFANSHQLCVIDVETTGLNPDKHEIIEICFLPLDESLSFIKKPVPFNIKIKPEKEIDFEAFNINTIDYDDLMNTGIDKWKAVDLFIDWFDLLRLPPNKRLLPIAHNWFFDASFIKQWLGSPTFDSYIDSRARDTLMMCQFINDSHSMRHDNVPFPKQTLAYVASQLDIEHTRAHNALDDCVVTAKIYKQLLMSYKVM